MVATRTIINKFGARDRDAHMEGMNPPTTSMCCRRYSRSDLEDQDDDLEDDDPGDDGANKEEEGYYYELDPEFIQMAKELAKTKNKLAKQEDFSRQMQETLTRLEAIIELGNVVPDENIPDEPAPRAQGFINLEEAYVHAYGVPLTISTNVSKSTLALQFFASTITPPKSVFITSKVYRPTVSSQAVAQTNFSNYRVAQTGCSVASRQAS
uniref:Uncharacterized protein n=1 Tax=Cannabis sativa TaxID=3483 RepID=A0A803NJF9_CANSA